MGQWRWQISLALVPDTRGFGEFAFFGLFFFIYEKGGLGVAFVTMDGGGSSIYGLEGKKRLFGSAVSCARRERERKGGGGTPF